IPSVGLGISANMKSLSVSIAAEFSAYGEKTNYYPYSNQTLVTPDDYWQTLTVTSVDTDTAYYRGNYLFLQNPFSHLDSSYVQSWDTTEEYKYDKGIADANGVNRFYYIELPVEVSYCFTKGRAGVGVSAGISPAMLITEKGHYLRS